MIVYRNCQKINLFWQPLNHIKMNTLLHNPHTMGIKVIINTNLILKVFNILPIVANFVFVLLNYYTWKISI